MFSLFFDFFGFFVFFASARDPVGLVGFEVEVSEVGRFGEVEALQEARLLEFEVFRGFSGV